MKRYYVITTIIFSIIIIGGGILIYNSYIKPTYANYSTRSLTIQAPTLKPIKIEKYHDQISIFNIEIELTGKASQNLFINIGSDSTLFTHQVQLKKGEIDFLYKNDWYANNCYIKIETENGNEETLQLDYRFISLN